MKAAHIEAVRIGQKVRWTVTMAKGGLFLDVYPMVVTEADARARGKEIYKDWDAVKAVRH